MYLVGFLVGLLVDFFFGFEVGFLFNCNDGCSVGANDGWRVGTMKSDNYNNIKVIIKSSSSISIIIDTTTIGILVLE